MLGMFAAVNASPPLPLVDFKCPPVSTHGILEIPDNARFIIVFAHGADSSNRSPRNRLVARALLQRGFAVLLPDLSDAGSDAPDSVLSNVQQGITRIAMRLTSVIDWLASDPATKGLRIGLFGGRTGAAAAMIAAALRPKKVHAVVSRGGRPDLAAEALRDVEAPTLMIVGSKDRAHLAHNCRAKEKMRRVPMLEVIHGANHLFGEPGKLEQVAFITFLWFQYNLALA